MMENGYPLFIEILQRHVMVHVTKKRNDISYNLSLIFLLIELIILSDYRCVISISLDYYYFIRRKSFLFFKKTPQI